MTFMDKSSSMSREVDTFDFYKGDDEPTPSGWLKVHRYAEVPEQDGYLPLPSIYAYRLAIG